MFPSGKNGFLVTQDVFLDLKSELFWFFLKDTIWKFLLKLENDQVMEFPIWF